jgi:hypothetical protein
MSLFSFPYIFSFPLCSLELITHIDKNIEMACISLLIKPFIKTNPVLKAKLAVRFKRIPLNHEHHGRLTPK